MKGRAIGDDRRDALKAPQRLRDTYSWRVVSHTHVDSSGYLYATHLSYIIIIGLDTTKAPFLIKQIKSRSYQP